MMAHIVHCFGDPVNDEGRATASGHFMNRHPCPPTDKISEDCPKLGEKQWQTIPAEKSGNRFESRFE
jgi:hypothetical protein